MQRLGAAVNLSSKAAFPLQQLLYVSHWHFAWYFPESFASASFHLDHCGGVAGHQLRLLLRCLFFRQFCNAS